MTPRGFAGAVELEPLREPARGYGTDQPERHTGATKRRPLRGLSSDPGGPGISRIETARRQELSPEAAANTRVMFLRLGYSSPVEHEHPWE